MNAVEMLLLFREHHWSSPERVYRLQGRVEVEKQFQNLWASSFAGPVHRCQANGVSLEEDIRAMLKHAHEHIEDGVALHENYQVSWPHVLCLRVHGYFNDLVLFEKAVVALVL